MCRFDTADFGNDFLSVACLPQAFVFASFCVNFWAVDCVCCE